MDKNFKTIKEYEYHLDQLRGEKKFKERQDENLAKEQELKRKQREKAEKARNQVLFRGMPMVPRSTKKAFKPVTEKREEMSPRTREQKEYLDIELFEILQQQKKQKDEDSDETREEAK